MEKADAQEWISLTTERVHLCISVDCYVTVLKGKVFVTNRNRQTETSDWYSGSS